MIIFLDLLIVFYYLIILLATSNLAPFFKEDLDDLSSRPFASLSDTSV